MTDLVAPEAPVTIGDFAAVAVAAGCRRLVLLPSRGEVEAEACEQAVIAAGAEWTVLRASWFARNFSENFFRDGLVAGELVCRRRRSG